MMVDLIDRQAALAWCKKDDWGTPDERWKPESEYGGYIEALPTVDAVEVVRCRDCKHNPNDTWFECPISNLPYKEDRWCWKGERQ